MSNASTTNANDATTANMSDTNKVSATATTTMKSVVALLGTVDKHELNRSQVRIKIGSLVPKLRSEYGKGMIKALHEECGKSKVRASISIGTLNVWACMAVFHNKVNPAIEQLSEKEQRKYATLYNADVTAEGEEPTLKKETKITAAAKKAEFPQLREWAKDETLFYKQFGIKNKAAVVKVTENAITGMFTKLRKMKEDERNALIALIKKELAVPVVPKASKAKKGTKHTLPVGGTTEITPPPMPTEEETPANANVDELVTA